MTDIADLYGKHQLANIRGKRRQSECLINFFWL